jgi:cyclic pyranopterin phosphate synthase
MTKFSHTDEKGRARMVDVGNKPVQKRQATACGLIRLQPETMLLIRENNIKKGDVLSVSEMAGVMAAKQTASLIPLCHPLQITSVTVNSLLTEEGIEATACVKCNGQTGVEMEALTAVSVALLTIYDMCKAVDKHMVIEKISLIEKTKS